MRQSQEVNFTVRVRYLLKTFKFNCNHDNGGLTQYSIKLTLMEMISIQELLEDSIKKEKEHGTRNIF